MADQFRGLLEEHAFALTSATNLRQLVPFTHHVEVSRLNEIANRPPSISYLMALLMCLKQWRSFYDSSPIVTWEIKQCL